MSSVSTGTFGSIELAYAALKRIEGEECDHNPDCFCEASDYYPYELSVHEKIDAPDDDDEVKKKSREAGLASLAKLMELLSQPVGRTVKTLNLSRMKLGSRGAEIVARMLRNNDTLKHL
ncbi:MAG: hypothetical protein ACHQUC_08345, partial [Chlamydiales bacterium]